MEPWFAASVLAALTCVGTNCYFFRIPDNLRLMGQGGRWGVPDAEFNWCEPDYMLLDWIAEPVNTISNIIFVLAPITFLLFHDASKDVYVQAFLIMGIGVGSMLFHASLRYTMQLCDELPMFWFVTLASASYLRRLRGVHIVNYVVAFGVAVTASILFTRQHSMAHEISRGVMTCTFSVCIVVMAWGSTAIVARMKRELTGKLRGILTQSERIHSIGFVLFVAAIGCWLCDNYFCPSLQQLPLKLPYPHLHMWWHILTAGALYCLLVLFQLDDKRASQVLGLKYCFGLPVVLS